MEFPRKIVEFSWNSFLNLFPDDPFSRSFSVVFAVISGENRRISEKNGEFWGNLSVFFPFLSTSFLFIPPPQISQILCSKTYFLQILCQRG